MSNLIRTDFEEKAGKHKRPLYERNVYPCQRVHFEKKATAFQGVCPVVEQEKALPVIMNPGDSVTLDFGDHWVGYLNFSLIYTEIIAGSPVRLKFTFGEKPLEMTTPAEEYHGLLGNGWLQYEEKFIPFLPYSGQLERRYAFRYLRIERMDNARFPIALTDIFVKAVTSADVEKLPDISFEDEQLDRIYEMCVNTLRDCEQDVFEDGPKRDRRLWIGDFRLQALTDYVTFKNEELIRRCFYLFAAYTIYEKMVPACIFTESPPYVMESDFFLDYSMFFGVCLYDWYKATGDIELVKELFDVAHLQLVAGNEMFEKDPELPGQKCFVDWCLGLDKSVAAMGIFCYIFQRMEELGNVLGKDTSWYKEAIKEYQKELIRHLDKDKGVFVTEKGQLSWHSQIWAVLSGALSMEECRNLLIRTKEIDPEYIIHTPYMMHCYIEALYSCGMKQEALDVIREYWGAIAAAGYDCCPEVFDPNNDMESSGNQDPVIDSCCHAWSCTPAYWLQKLKEVPLGEERRWKN